MSLLSDNDANQILSEIKSISNTFFVHDVTLLVARRKAQTFSEDSGEAPDEIPLKAFIRWNDAGSSIREQGRTEGMMDLSLGYMLFNVEDLAAVNLYSDNKPLITKNSAHVVYAGEEFTIMGVERIAPVLTKWGMVKIELEEKI